MTIESLRIGPVVQRRRLLAYNQRTMVRVHPGSIVRRQCDSSLLMGGRDSRRAALSLCVELDARLGRSLALSKAWHAMYARGIHELSFISHVSAHSS